MPTQHRLECDGVLALAREARELPDQDLLERRARRPSLIEHPLELGPVGDAAAFCFVDIPAHDGVGTALGVVAEGAKLRCHREINVLAVA